MISTDHDWVQALPLSANELVCQRCGYRCPMQGKNDRACVPHGESPTSGWKDASTGKHWDGKGWVL